MSAQNTIPKIQFSAITLFPEMFETLRQDGVVGSAIRHNLIGLETIFLRNFSDNKRNSVDDKPAGGGDGMIIKADVVERAVKSVKTADSYVIHITPHGKVFDQEKARQLSQKKHIIFLNGRYGGIDHRVNDTIADENLSLGDFILSGGELAALCFMDAIARFVPGVLGNSESPENDSFHEGLLEAPQYTKPLDFMGQKIPAILLGGDHQKIEKLRRVEQLKVTAKYRPDLILAQWDQLSASEKKIVEKYLKHKS